MHTHLWAQGPSGNAQVQLQYLLLDSGNMPAASHPVDAFSDVQVSLAAFWQFYTLVSLPVAGLHAATGLARRTWELC